MLFAFFQFQGLFGSLPGPQGLLTQGWGCAYSAECCKTGSEDDKATLVDCASGVCHWRSAHIRNSQHVHIHRHCGQERANDITGRLDCGISVSGAPALGLLPLGHMSESKNS